MSNILNHVKLKGNQTGFSIPAIDKPQKSKERSYNLVNPVLDILPANKRPLIDSNPNKFKKIPGEKEQLKEMKKAFLSKHKAVNPYLTKKQINATFGSAVKVS